MEGKYMWTLWVKLPDGTEIEGAANLFTPMTSAEAIESIGEIRKHVTSMSFEDKEGDMVALKEKLFQNSLIKLIRLDTAQTEKEG